jgi:hypothetical protein
MDDMAFCMLNNMHDASLYMQYDNTHFREMHCTWQFIFHKPVS